MSLATPSDAFSYASTGHAFVPHWLHTPEDSHYWSDVFRMGAVFDGLGGHGDGDVASGIAADSVRLHAREMAFQPDSGFSTPPLDTTLADSREALRIPYEQCKASGRYLALPDKAPLQLLELARLDLVHARQKLQELARQNQRRKDLRPHMTCTAALAIVDGHEARGAWCGDSRVYRLREGRLARITEDHDMLYTQYMRSMTPESKTGAIRAALDEARTQSEAYHIGGPQAKKVYRRRHEVSSDLSSGDIGLFRVPCGPGDLLILTTDGVHDNMRRSDMQATVTEAWSAEGATPQSVADALVSAAETAARSGEYDYHPDDITAVVLAG